MLLVPPSAALRLTGEMAKLGSTAPHMKTLTGGMQITVPVDTGLTVGDIRPELAAGLSMHNGMLTAELKGRLELRDYAYSVVACKGDAGAGEGEAVAAAAADGPVRPPSLQQLLWALAMHGVYDVSVQDTALGHIVRAGSGIVELSADETLVDLRNCPKTAATSIRLSIAAAMAASSSNEDGMADGADRSLIPRAHHLPGPPGPFFL